jgi:DNA-binding transcriptional ArsR family regulator
MMVGMDDTIKLDRRSFEALAAESRVNALKALSRRRKTLTELSNELGLSVSTMKEHLDVLVKAGLIIQKDEGRKWKYYELTRKGKGIVNPYPAKVLIMLAVSLILVFGSGWNFINAFGEYAGAGMDAAPAEGFMPGVGTYEEDVPRAYTIAEADAGDDIGGDSLEVETIDGKTVAEAEKYWVPEPYEAEQYPGPEKAEEPEFPLFWAMLFGLCACFFAASLYYVFIR